MAKRISNVSNRLENSAFCYLGKIALTDETAFRVYEQIAEMAKSLENHIDRLSPFIYGSF